MCIILINDHSLVKATQNIYNLLYIKHSPIAQPGQVASILILDDKSHKYLLRSEWVKIRPPV